MKKEDERIVNRDGVRDEVREVSRENPRVSDDVRKDAIPQSPEELAHMLRNEALANALPNPPKVPGWHMCWLSTTNTYTPIQQYVRLGYVPVKRSEMPEWSFLKHHSAEHGGDVITCNEMVLYKIPDEAYQQIMRVMHFDRPNEEAQRLRNNIEEMKEGSDFRDSEGQSLVKEEGDWASLADRRARVGRFD